MCVLAAAVSAGILAGCAGGGEGGGKTSDRELLNGFYSSLFLADGTPLAPLDVATGPGRAVPLFVSAKASAESVGPAEPASLDMSQVHLGDIQARLTRDSAPAEGEDEAEDEAEAQADLSRSRGTGAIEKLGAEPGRFLVLCESFYPESAVYQFRGDVCWAASVAMIERYQLGLDGNQEEILARIKGRQAESEELGSNFANIYEIILALNPDAAPPPPAEADPEAEADPAPPETDSGLEAQAASVTEQAQEQEEAVQSSGELKYIAVHALAFTRGNTTSSIYFGLRQASRFMGQFIGTEEMLSSLASGEPVIVGLRRPVPGGAPGQTFNHAMVLYAAEFTAIPAEASTERGLYQAEAGVNTALAGYDLLIAQAKAEKEAEESGEEPTLADSLEQITTLGAGAGRLLGQGWNALRGGNKEQSSRPYWLAITKVHLVDPLGDPEQAGNPFESKVVLDGQTFRDTFLFAMTHRRAQTIRPVVDDDSTVEEILMGTPAEDAEAAADSASDSAS
ncbi:MAG: hypothetical protein AAFX76_11230 [Planctomycetota bacterium]